MHGAPLWKTELPVSFPCDPAALRLGKKCFERTDVMLGATLKQAVVYNCGTLHGAWPDGVEFEGNCYVDRYVICQILST